MIKIFYIFIAIIFSFNVYGQNAQCIKGKKYKGYVFPKDHNALIGIQNQSSRFVPDKKDIEYFESVLRERIVNLTKEIPDQGERCPNIAKKLRKYTRQYFGFITNDQERVLYVNFVWSKSDDLILSKINTENIGVYGGCSFYWNVKYNLDTDVFYDLRVNTKD